MKSIGLFSGLLALGLLAAGCIFGAEQIRVYSVEQGGYFMSE
jgi:hypothetical protein